METLTTSALADQAGVNLQTIRYYERRGLLPAPPRTNGGYRQFGPDAVARIRFIRRAQELGFSLDEVEDLLALRADAAADRAEVRRATEAKIADIEAKIRDLERMRSILRHLADACHGHGTTSECPILDALAES
jgi:Hg(II)-responsive transcriptional regulator